MALFTERDLEGRILRLEKSTFHVQELYRVDENGSRRSRIRTLLGRLCDCNFLESLPPKFSGLYRLVEPAGGAPEVPSEQDQREHSGGEGQGLAFDIPFPGAPEVPIALSPSDLDDDVTSNSESSDEALESVSSTSSEENQEDVEEDMDRLRDVRAKVVLFDRMEQVAACNMIPPADLEANGLGDCRLMTFACQNSSKAILKQTEGPRGHELHPDGIVVDEAHYFKNDFDPTLREEHTQEMKTRSFRRIAWKDEIAAEIEKARRGMQPLWLEQIWVPLCAWLQQGRADAAVRYSAVEGKMRSIANRAEETRDQRDNLDRELFQVAQNLFQKGDLRDFVIDRKFFNPGYVRPEERPELPRREEDAGEVYRTYLRGKKESERRCKEECEVLRRDRAQWSEAEVLWEKQAQAGMMPETHQVPRPFQVAAFRSIEKGRRDGLKRSTVLDGPCGGGKAQIAGHAAVVAPWKKVYVFAPYQVHVKNLIEAFARAARGNGNICLVMLRDHWRGLKPEVKALMEPLEDGLHQRLMDLVGSNVGDVIRPDPASEVYIPEHCEVLAISATPQALMTQDFRTKYRMNVVHADDSFLVESGAVVPPRLVKAKIEKIQADSSFLTFVKENIPKRLLSILRRSDEELDQLIKVEVKKLAALIMECLDKTIVFRKSKSEDLTSPLQNVWGFCNGNTMAELRSEIVKLFNTAEGKQVLQVNCEQQGRTLRQGSKLAGVREMRRAIEQLEIKSESTKFTGQLEADQEAIRQAMRGRPRNQGVHEGIAEQRNFPGWGALQEIEAIRNRRSDAEAEEDPMTKQRIEEEICRMERELPPIQLHFVWNDKLLMAGVDNPDLHGVWIDKTANSADFKQMVGRAMRTSRQPGQKHCCYLIFIADPPANAAQQAQGHLREVYPNEEVRQAAQERMVRGVDSIEKEEFIEFVRTHRSYGGAEVNQRRTGQQYYDSVIRTFRGFFPERLPMRVYEQSIRRMSNRVRREADDFAKVAWKYYADLCKKKMRKRRADSDAAERRVRQRNQ